MITFDEIFHIEEKPKNNSLKKEILKENIDKKDISNAEEDPWNNKPCISKPLSVPSIDVSDKEPCITSDTDTSLSKLNFQERLLERSTLKNNLIFDYVKENCQTVDPAYLHNLTDNCFYAPDGSTYILNEKDESEIVTIISSLTDKEVVSLTNKKFSYFSSQRENIEKTFDTIKDTNIIYTSLTAKGFAHIILYIISRRFNYNLNNIKTT